MENHVEKVYEEFDNRRKSYDALFADQNDLTEINKIEEQIKHRKSIDPE